MNAPVSNKVTNDHLSRRAYLYVRQSTMHQVVANAESTRRQYALQDRALALGWCAEQIVVDDSDLGCSAAASGRQGFQTMVGEVSMGKVGVVLGLEVSRLARNSSDWHRLVEICAFTDTLIVDEDGVYNPNDFNDRLVLGIKGTMSEAELHILKSRLRGGLINCAERGELRMRLPAGLVYDPCGRVVLDPDRRVQESIHHLFDIFEQTGSAGATFKHYRKHRLKLPKYVVSGARRGDVVWEAPVYGRLIQILHNPRYAGAYCYGRTRSQRQIDGQVAQHRVARDQWRVLIRDAHAGYISWERFEHNQQILKNNQMRTDGEGRGAVREGRALLQGLVVCGNCGKHMTVHYHAKRSTLSYRCNYASMQRGESICQSIVGTAIDRAVGELLIELLAPCHLEAALAIESQLEKHASEVEQQHRNTVEQTQFEADLARQRFMQVAPDNRLVASTLEDEWNRRLRDQQQAEEQLREFQQRSPARLDDVQRQRVMALAEDFAELWCHEDTPNRERKRMLRLVVEDVTIRKTDTQVHVGVRLRGGSEELLKLPLPQPAYEKYRTPADVVTAIDTLLERYTEAQAADLLNEKGCRSGRGKPFNQLIVRRICKTYQLKSRRQRLQDQGFLTIREMADQLDIDKKTLNRWRRDGLLRGHHYGKGFRILYEVPDESELKKIIADRSSQRSENTMNPKNVNEVQYAA